MLHLQCRGVCVHHQTAFVYEFHALIGHVRLLLLTPTVVSHINAARSRRKDRQTGEKADEPKPGHKETFIETYMHERNHKARPADSKPTCFVFLVVESFLLFSNYLHNYPLAAMRRHVFFLNKADVTVQLFNS